MTPEQSGTLLFYLAPSTGGFTMIFLAKKLMAAESEADLKEFVRGITATDKTAKKKTLAYFVSGYVLTAGLKKK
jgi:hypothetical protein